MIRILSLVAFTEEEIALLGQMAKRVALWAGAGILAQLLLLISPVTLPALLHHYYICLHCLTRKVISTVHRDVVRWAWQS